MKTFTVAEGGKNVEVEYPPKGLMSPVEEAAYEMGARAYARALANGAGARHGAALLDDLATLRADRDHWKSRAMASLEDALLVQEWPDEGEGECDE